METYGRPARKVRLVVLGLRMGGRGRPCRVQVLARDSSFVCMGREVCSLGRRGVRYRYEYSDSDERGS